METVKEMLDRLERDITSQIHELQRGLVPLERELANVRRARAALDKDDSVVGTGRVISIERPDVKITPASPYQNLTMKQLAVKALKEHFQNGATANKLIKFFADAWGRTDIARASFSPQLSRLKTEGVIARDGLVWRLVRSEDEMPDMWSGTPDHHDEGDGNPSSNEGREDTASLATLPGASPAHPGE